MSACAAGDIYTLMISRAILTYIEQPPIARKPVGYQQDFVDTYRPNKTWYVSDSLRRQLHKMGKATVCDGNRVMTTLHTFALSYFTAPGLAQAGTRSLRGRNRSAASSPLSADFSDHFRHLASGHPQSMLL